MGEAGGEGMENLRGTPMASAKNIQFQKAKVLPFLQRLSPDVNSKGNVKDLDPENKVLHAYS
jgi:hypothetical protein